MKHISKNHLIGLCIFIGSLTNIFAGESKTTDPADSFLDLWNIPQLYSDKDSNFINDLKLIGRYQWQYGDVDFDDGNYSDFEVRRLKLGTEAKILGGDWEVKGEINVDDEFSPFYKSLEEAYIRYQASDKFNVTIGKQKPKWSYEWSTSDGKILTFERSLLTNQLSPEKSTGINLSGSIDNWSYSLGVYNGNIDEEFGNFDDAGEFVIASLGYDYSESSSFDKAAWRFDILHNNDEGNNAAKAYENSFSLSHSLSAGKIDLNADLIHASGYSDDAYGIILLPTYDLNDKLQLVGRYTYANGDNDGLRAQKRYERKVPLTDGGYGNSYQSFYLGLNYYLNDHRLKLMTGIEYADMDGGSDGGDYDGLTLFSGFRFYF